MTLCQRCLKTRPPISFRDTGDGRSICEVCRSKRSNGSGRPASKGAAVCVHCGAGHSTRRSYCGTRCQIMAGCSGTGDPNGCWPWMRCTRENGYGLMRVLIDGKYRMRSPPRVMYAIEYGEVPFAYSVLHKCRTKNCCNPKHLKLKVQELDLAA